MAGAGSRFADAGYDTPKPFIDVKGMPMISRVLENLKYEGARYYLIARKEHIDHEKELAESILKQYNAEFIFVDRLTEGTACTVLFARKFINNDDPLLIANSDQIVDMNIADYIDDCKQRNLDGSILTFIEDNGDTKWSYAKINDDGVVLQVREKEAISKYATVGIYYYSKGKYFVDAAMDMIIEQDKVNNEYYTCPAYNYMVREDLKVGIYNIEYDQMHGIGTPEDLDAYLKLI